MAVGKEIKVTLSLDDSGYSIKMRGAGEAAGLLEKNLSSLTSQTSKTETAIADASGSLKGFADGFGALQKSLASTVSTLTNTVARSFTDLSAQSKAATKEVQTAATAQVDARLRVLKNEVDTNKQLVDARAKSYADLRRLQSEMLSQSIGAQEAADKARRSKKAGSGAQAADLEKEASRLLANSNAVRDQANALDRFLTVQARVQAAREKNIAKLEQERQVILQNAAAEGEAARQRAAMEKAIGDSNAKNVQKAREAATKRDAEAAVASKKSAEDMAKYKKLLLDQEVRDAKTAEIERLAAAREAAAERRRIAAQEAAQSRAEARAIADMWKGMAQMYAGSKIEGGIKASVGEADHFQRSQTAAAALNLPADQLAEINKNAWDDSKALKFVSALDMIQARLAAIGGMGGNDKKFIDQTLQYATTAAHNMQYIAGDKSPEAMRDMVRNIYGVIEARQQTNDPEAAKRTIDLIQRINTGTGGKIDIKDLETYLRRDATGADKISDMGLARIVAFLDQAKVSGGGMGGAGVSTVGTMIKMFQSMANGKMMTVGGATEFAESGLMDLSVMDGKKGKAAMRALRTGGLNVASLANEDPVLALETIAKAALTYMSKPENLKKFFPDGADPKDPKAIKDAMMKFAVGTGWTTTAVNALTTAANPVAMERADKQANTVMNSKDTKGLAADVAGTYGANLDNFNKSMDNLKITVGTAVLPLLSKLFDVISGIVNSAQQFAQNNPLATELTVIAAAAGGAVLSFKGFMSMFGMVGSMGNMLRMLTGTMTGVGAATATAGTQAAASGGMWAALTGHFTNAWTSIKAGASVHIPALNASVLGMAGAINGGGSAGSRIGLGFRSIGTAAGAMSKVVGGAFLRMLPLVGELVMAWDFAQLVAGMEVGGARVDTWLVSWGDRMITWAKNVWIDIKSAFASGAAEAELSAEKARNNAELQNRLRANGTQTAAEKAKDADAPRAKQALADIDAVNDPNYQANYQKHQEEAQKRWAAEHPVVAKPVVAPKPKIPAAMPPTPSQQAAIDAALGGADGRKNERDPLTQALGEAEGKVKEQQAKLKSIVAGAETVDSLREQADALIRGKWNGGDYSPGRSADPKKRPDWDGDKMKRLREAEAQKMLNDEQIKAITFANERVVAGSTEINAAMERIADDGAPKQTDAFKALNKELERAQSRLGAGAGEFVKWKQAKDIALFEQAGADAANYAADLHASNKKDKIDLLPTERERQVAQLALTAETEEKAYQIRHDNLEKWKNESIKSIWAEGPPSKESQDKITDIKATAEKVRDEIDKEASERRIIRQQQEALALSTAADKTALQWKDTYKAVDQIASDAMGGFVSMIMSSLETGHLAVKDFLKKILEEITEAKLKESLADPLKTVVNAGANWVGQNVFGISGAGAGAGGLSATAAAQARAAADTSAATATTGMSTSILTQVIPALEAFAARLAGSSAGGAGGGGIFGSLFGGSGSSIGAVSDAGGGTDWSGIASLASESFFANGGIMTSMGAMPLRKYANGGIANSPQVAIHGEAGPEAYVPLPDGRSIPVTMKGAGTQQQGAAPVVSVNVINQTSTPVNAQQNGTRFDGKQMILDVVLTAASQPGSFRSGMKDAMKGTG